MLLVPNGMRLEWRNEMSRFLASTAGAADSRRSLRERFPCRRTKGDLQSDLKGNAKKLSHRLVRVLWQTLLVAWVSPASACQNGKGVSF